MSLLGDRLGGFLGWVRKILRRVEERQLLLLAVFEDVDRTDEARLVKEDPRAIEEEPGDAQVNDDRDVDGLAEAGFGALVVERVEQVDELVLFEFAVTAGAHLDGRDRRRGVGRYLEGGHGL